MNPVRFGVSTLWRAARVVDRVTRGAQLRGVSLDIHPSARFNASGVAPQAGCAIRVGESSLVDGTIAFDRPDAAVSIGKRTFMNGRLVSAASITIGDDVLIAWGVTIVDHDSHSVSFSKRAGDVVNWARGDKDWTHVATAPVTIADKVWIGFDAIILKGTSMGEGAVVGAGSVVSRDVPPWTVVAGNPARVIRTLDPSER